MWPREQQILNKALSEQLEGEEKNTEQAVEAAIQDKLKLEAVINNLEAEEDVEAAETVAEIE